MSGSEKKREAIISASVYLWSVDEKITFKNKFTKDTV
jgi:hypothetical protein